jgi:hypothetical protein
LRSIRAGRRSGSPPPPHFRRNGRWRRPSFWLAVRPAILGGSFLSWLRLTQSLWVRGRRDGLCVVYIDHQCWFTLLGGARGMDYFWSDEIFASQILLCKTIRTI